MAKTTLTASRIAKFNCPDGKSQAFLWDDQAPGLGLRVTPKGRPAFVFQGEYQGATVRMTIGSPDVWPLENRKDRVGPGARILRQGAREEARRIQALIDSGRDPRVAKAETSAADVATRAADHGSRVAVGEAWAIYLEDRRSKWGARHYSDHVNLSKPGDVLSARGTRGKGRTVPGPLYPLMGVRLRDLSPERVEDWATATAAKGRTSGRLAWRLLKAFLQWCTEHREFKEVVRHRNPAKGKRIQEAFGTAMARRDVLQREQLAVWFATVQRIPNAVIAAYLQALLLTGARPNELLGLKWADIDWQWRSMTLRDKVTGKRVVPLTPYVAALIAALPRINVWVFSSPLSASGCLVEPRAMHKRAVEAAGVAPLTLQGLRRSFKTLSEWLDKPVGVVAQIMGHKPSATAEKNYTVRPIDFLRMHHERIECWILEQAGICLNLEPSDDAVKTKKHTARA